MHYLMVNRSLQ